MGNSELPLHLLLPFAASALFVVGLMLIKKASSYGVGPWTVTFVANLWAALVFSTLLLMGGLGQPLSQLWQPAVIGVLYILGQVFTFVALSRGDVSVATPVFSVKVLLVAVLVTVVAHEQLPAGVWAAAALATVGIALVQRSSSASQHSRVAFTVAFALLAATTFSFFDVLVQRWAPAWGAGQFLPIAFAIAAVLSLGFLPWIDKPSLIARKAILPLLVGTLCIALQAICIVFALAHFGDEARVNVVYALRGLWGVVLAFAFARVLNSGEAGLSTRVTISRLIGAGLLTAAVVMAILAK
jgi:drug/metabolite transporter (DMT)-like permease